MPNNNLTIPTSVSPVVSLDSAILEIQRGLGRVEGKMDQVLLSAINHEELDKNRFRDVFETTKEIEERVGRLEKKVWYAAGFGAALAFIVSHLPFKNIFS